MLEQLTMIIAAYERGACSKDKAYSEISIWLSQHCVAADDFAFSLGCRARDYYA